MADPNENTQPGPVEEPEISPAEASNAAEVIMATFPWLADIPGIFDIILAGVVGDLPNEMILSNIRGSEPYMARFPAMAARKSAGFNPITEYEYLQYEDDYRGLLSSFGVLGTVAPTAGALQDLMTDWISGDVSPMELSTRLDSGYAAMSDAAPGVREAFRDFYGIEIDDATLLTYFLDKDLGLQEMERVVAASTVGGAAYQYGLNITRTRAELLYSRGVTGDLAKAGYADIARETPQLQKLASLHRYNPLSQEDLEDFTFHEDPTVAASRRRIFDTALADFMGAGVTSVTQQGTLGELVDTDQSV